MILSNHFHFILLSIIPHYLIHIFYGIFRIQETIRRLLHLIPTDPAVLEVLGKVASRRSAASAFSTAASFDVDVRSRPSVGSLNVLSSSNTGLSSPFTRVAVPTVVGHATIATSPTKSAFYICLHSRMLLII
jgi:hypothetical protein